MGSAQTLHQIHVDRAAIEAKVQRAVADWRGLLSGSVADGRQLLREVLEAPLRFTPDGRTYRFTAPVATGKLIAGAVLPTKMASPRGGLTNRIAISTSIYRPARWTRIGHQHQRLAASV
jgi:hypothetical protein